MIGETVIDLDDRFFNPRWQSMHEKPIEMRDLKHPSTNLSQGVIEMWLDLIKISKKKDEEAVSKIWEISEEPEKEYEVRVCVMSTENIPAEDIEGTTDAYITA